MTGDTRESARTIFSASGEGRFHLSFYLSRYCTNLCTATNPAQCMILYYMTADAFFFCKICFGLLSCSTKSLTSPFFCLFFNKDRLTYIV